MNSGGVLRTGRVFLLVATSTVAALAGTGGSYTRPQAHLVASDASGGRHTCTADYLNIYGIQ